MPETNDLGAGQLYLVATPIGNLEDLTYRAAKTLKKVEVIACEDTRVTGKLLNYFGIENKVLLSCHAHNEKERSEEILGFLVEGKNVAFVSDAGTPGVSDPGAFLTKLALERGIVVVPIPGASAVTALISVSALSSSAFCFYGFLPRKEAELRDVFRLAKLRSEPFLFYESPNRILKSLQCLLEEAPESQLCLGREMTKMYEEFFYGSPGELVERLKKKESIKGEFAGLISFQTKPQSEYNPLFEKPSFKTCLKVLCGKSGSLSKKEASKVLNDLLGVPTKTVYQACLELDK